MAFRILIDFLMLAVAAGAKADAIDSLQTVLTDKAQIQEKIYIHTDNTCYFIGDTLWYKAYVLKSDNLKPTNISKLLYVELLTPDGMLVERQHIVISDSGVTCGQFELKDSLYSGYYELRAYTKWDLNFNVGERYYSLSDKRKFYSKQLCADYYRDFEGLYSRVLPVYARPEIEGDWSQRFMYSRPKQRLLKEKRTLTCNFYPEGGALVDGIKQRVAFELTDNYGLAMDLEGRLPDSTIVRPTHNGRGIFEMTPTADEKTKLTFTFEGKNYTFTLSKAEKAGTVINYDPMSMTVTLESKGVTPKAVAIMCRGRLSHFERIDASKNKSIQLKNKNIKLKTGINEIIVYDENANALASRLFFINNHDMSAGISVKVRNDEEEINAKKTIDPFARLSVEVQAEEKNGALPKTVSLAVRDSRSDEPTYDDGNILTDMLLSGDLKGFVANPAYYFSSDDEEHTRNLDLLLMVQGWRKYKRIGQGRYLPEKGLTYEGQVLKIPSTAEISDGYSLYAGDNSESYNGETMFVRQSPDNHSPHYLKKPVYVEAELALSGETYGAVAETDKQGNFRINLPAFYDVGVLFVKAYNKSDSLKSCLTARQYDKHFMDETSYPDYYVKREMFFPIFSQPYSWYQTHIPVQSADADEDLYEDDEDIANSITLQNVDVKEKRRRGKRGIDYTKPALVRDVYQVYNDLTDYGLSFGVFNFMDFPYQVAKFLYGNMGRANKLHVSSMINGFIFAYNFDAPAEKMASRYMTESQMLQYKQLNRLMNIRAYTDYDMRNDSGVVEESGSEDVRLVFEPVPDDGKRYTYRDRRYVFPGITYPEEFYNRSYQNAELQDPNDYRRTLYWNPNARLDEQGRFTDTFYNNSRETRIRVSATGVNAEGMMYSY